MKIEFHSTYLLIAISFILTGYFSNLIIFTSIIIFHELGHAIKNHKRHLTISYNKGNVKDEEELEADAFASNALINENDYRDFIKEEKFDISDIKLFAKKQKVAPFIVIGRLQKDGLIPWSSFQRYKIKYTIDF